jgi:hypothetical protein
MSHFNVGNVWGKVTKAKTGTTKDKHTPYLDLEIDCANQEYGNTRGFGRLWGEEKIASLNAWLAAHPKEMIRLKGFYEQYEEKGVRYSSYTFYDFLAVKPDDRPRAAFILVGDLAGKELVDGEPKLVMDVTRPGKEMDRELRLEVWLLDVMPYYEVEPGDLVEVRGLLRKREAEDLYGGSGEGPVRPYVMATKKRVRR